MAAGIEAAAAAGALGIGRGWEVDETIVLNLELHRTAYGGICSGHNRSVGRSISSVDSG